MSVLLQRTCTYIIYTYTGLIRESTLAGNSRKISDVLAQSRTSISEIDTYKTEMTDFMDINSGRTRRE